MSRPAFAPAAFYLLALLGGLFVTSTASADSPKDAAKTGGTVGGLLVDVLNDGITVVIDGDEDVTKFLYGGGVDKQSLGKRAIFNVDRVNVKFKVDGDNRTLVAIEKVVGKPQGVVIGEVLKVYNNFWVAVKPKTGNIDGYALNWPPEKFKDSHDLIKTLKKGDIVAIRYGTDFERHRILKMEVKPAPSK